MTFYINPLPQPEQKSFIQQVIEVCAKAEPKPPYCRETPEGLKFSMDTSGTPQQYLYVVNAAQGTTASGIAPITLPLTYIVGK